MEQPVNYKHKIDFLISDNTPSIQPTQKSNTKGSSIRNTILKPVKSGNKVIDDFIRSTQINYGNSGVKLEFVPYDQFKNIKFIAEGGFSKIYKAIWVNGPIINWHEIERNDWNITRYNNYTVVLKKLNNSKNTTSKELNELKILYQIASSTENQHIGILSEYYGITQEPNTKDIVFIMQYYSSGDLMHYLNNDFYNISWKTKLAGLWNITNGLCLIHDTGITHRDLHSGNIFFDNVYPYSKIGDLGISKSATECTDNNNENYGIIPYMAPEIFQGQTYTEASDIYSFGMIMWEFMTGRRPFWNENHDIELIIKICDGLRPPIVTNAPEGYIELMKSCWHSDPNKRPTATYLGNKIWDMYVKEEKSPTKIIKSSDIGPVTTNNPGAIYKSRPLSRMINSAMSLRNSRSQSIDPFYYYQKNNAAFIDKRKFDNSVEDDQNSKRRKLFGNENSEYFTKEIELDINKNLNEPQNNEYVTKEFDIDINNI
ncbi:unnamed protein product [Rhizophagus irregularis]|nr:unnamed protein product [Rhizophagus irregularis]